MEGIVKSKYPVTSLNVAKAGKVSAPYAIKEYTILVDAENTQVINKIIREFLFSSIFDEIFLCFNIFRSIYNFLYYSSYILRFILFELN